MSERIQNAPDLLPGLQFYVDAFNLLTRSRPVAQGIVGNIPYGEISRFCSDEGITGSMREDLFFLIGEMDRAFIEWKQKKTAAALEAAKRSSSPPSKPGKPRRR